MNRELDKLMSKERENKTGFLLILTGGTAVGKTETKERLSNKYSNLDFVVTTTTRKPRKEKGEENGVDYYFLSHDEFKEKMKNGEFIEYASYDGNMYGTTKEVIERIFSGVNLISAMEISGAANWEENIRKAYKNEKKKADLIISRTLVVLIEADSINSQRIRSAQRSLGNVGNLEERLIEDNALMDKFGQSFKHKVLNAQGKIEETLKEVENILTRNFPQSRLFPR